MNSLCSNGATSSTVSVFSADLVYRMGIRDFFRSCDLSVGILRPGGIDRAILPSVRLWCDGFVVVLVPTNENTYPCL